MKHLLMLAVFTTLALVGCATSKKSDQPNKPAVEKGLHGTIAYTIAIEASEPGTKIEVNHQMVGIAPLTVKVFGDKDGTFHNFGSDEYVIRGYPPRQELYPQTKIFKTGAFSIKDDKIPEKVFFDFGSAPNKPK
jgi:hypothetical protein